MRSVPWLCALVVGGLVSLMNGCVIPMHISGTTSSGADWRRISDVTPGSTTFAEILAWFGPPDFVIDGTQRMVDMDAVAQAGVHLETIPTRTLSAPEGEVILIYVEGELGLTVVIAVAGDNLGGMTADTQVRHNEYFIFLSKEDRTVTGTAGSPVE